MTCHSFDRLKISGFCFLSSHMRHHLCSVPYQKLDSYSELLMSSIDYAESTSHQLQPTKSGPLNIRLLKNIKDIVDDVKERQAWKASGVTTLEQNRSLPREKK